MKQYTVNVGNIGNIECTTLDQAISVYNDYVTQSKNNIGRVAGESVFLFEDDLIIMDYLGTIDANDEI